MEEIIQLPLALVACLGILGKMALDPKNSTHIRLALAGTAVSVLALLVGGLAMILLSSTPARWPIQTFLGGFFGIFLGLIVVVVNRACAQE